MISILSKRGGVRFCFSAAETLLHSAVLQRWWALVFQWFKAFSEGRDSIEDEPQHWRPSSLKNYFFYIYIIINKMFVYLPLKAKWSIGTFTRRIFKKFKIRVIPIIKKNICLSWLCSLSHSNLNKWVPVKTCMWILSLLICLTWVCWTWPEVEHSAQRNSFWDSQKH